MTHGCPSPIKSMMYIVYSPYFHKIYKFPLFSFNLRLLLHLRFFGFPYFDLDAFLHYALHVLDAPELTLNLYSFTRRRCSYESKCRREVVSVEPLFDSRE